MSNFLESSHNERNFIVTCVLGTLILSTEIMYRLYILTREK